MIQTHLDINSFKEFLTMQRFSLIIHFVLLSLKRNKTKWGKQKWVDLTLDFDPSPPPPRPPTHRRKQTLLFGLSRCLWTIAREKWAEDGSKEVKASIAIEWTWSGICLVLFWCLWIVRMMYGWSDILDVANASRCRGIAVDAFEGVVYQNHP